MTALPVTGLVSFPGSGNTWVRHLIQQMTGNTYGNISLKLEKGMLPSSKVKIGLFRVIYFMF